VKAARQAWADSRAELDPERLIFIDESGLSTKMPRLRGWAPEGERCHAAIPHGQLQSCYGLLAHTSHVMVVSSFSAGIDPRELRRAYPASPWSACPFNPGARTPLAPRGRTREVHATVVVARCNRDRVRTSDVQDGCGCPRGPQWRSHRGPPHG
jgi:hypothetical protein